MGMQFVIKAKDIKSIESSLGALSNQCEIFPIEAGCFGLSIPTQVIDSVGENSIREKLTALEFFDLWSGVWKKPKPNWKFW